MTSGCPHGANSSPDRCSQCIGARPRVVRSDEHGVTVDGAVVRGSPLKPETSSAPTGNGRRLGARAALERRARKPKPAPQPRPLHVESTHLPEPGQPPVAAPAPAPPDPAPELPVSPPRSRSKNRKPAITAPGPAEPAPAAAAPDIQPAVQAPESPAEPAVSSEPPAPPPRARPAPRPRTHARSPASAIATAKQLKAAETIIDYGETHATLAFPTPAGQEAVALLDCALDFAGTDTEVAELHRLGLIRLVALGNPPGLERSLRIRSKGTGHVPRFLDEPRECSPDVRIMHCAKERSRSHRSIDDPTPLELGDLARRGAPGGLHAGHHHDGEHDITEGQARTTDAARWLLDRGAQLLQQRHDPDRLMLDRRGRDILGRERRQHAADAVPLVAEEQAGAESEIWIVTVGGREPQRVRDEVLHGLVLVVHQDELDEVFRVFGAARGRDDLHAVVRDTVDHDDVIRAAPVTADRRGAGGLAPVITAPLYLRLRARLAALGYGSDYAWSQGLTPPATAEDLAREYVFVVVNSGMKSAVAQKIFDRVWPALLAGRPVRDVFGHDGKAAGIEKVWRLRADYFSCFQALAADGVVAWCETLPWIGPITRYHLAKNLGADVAKPDRWLERLAAAEGVTVEGLCARLARETGDRVATVDVVLWRACAIGVLVVEHDGDGWIVREELQRLTEDR